ncbi:hypothetical protein [Dokdonella sp.]|uniref:hypothetical protein n=1 Tax=Dokdonella sp. TaxID=2291710 RepID=UPI0031CBCDDB|nr:hypothetical protein [Dokdonella sp.]
MKRMTLVMLCIAMAQIASAQSSTGTVSIDGIRTGWNLDAFAIETVQPIINPASCSAPDGYMIDSTMPGYQTFLSASLTAFSLNFPVAITVDGTRCVAQRPRIVGVNIMR